MRIEGGTMKPTERLFRQMKESQLIALLSPKQKEDCVVAYEALSPLGIVLEIAFRTETALEGIQLLLKKYSQALVLAGTVMTPKQAEQAISIGVSGIVSADFIPAVVETCVKSDILCIPGGHGDVGKQLVLKAERYGCSLDELRERYPYQWIHKLFPAVTQETIFVGMGPAWRGPFKELTVVYTGGILLSNLEKVFRMDPQGIFCGSALTASIEEPSRMIEEAKQWISTLHSIRSSLSK